MPRTRPFKPNYRKTSGGAGRGGKFHEAAIDPNSFLHRLSIAEKITTVTGASPEFAEAMTRELANSFSGDELSEMQRLGVSVHVIRSIQDQYPELATQSPRGWGEEFTWSQADGLARGKTAVVAEYAGAHQSRRGPGVLRHELGHVMDDIKQSSDSLAFRRAHAADIASMSKETRANYGYFTQPGAAGREETFAEIYAALHGGGASFMKVIATFPETAKLIKK